MSVEVDDAPGVAQDGDRAVVAGGGVSAATVAGTASQCKLKYLASINDDVLGENTDPDFEMEYIDIGNVDSSGHVSKLASYRFEDAPSRARRLVRDGDVIISTVRTYLQAITQIREPSESLVVSTGFAVVCPRRDLFDARYCRFALREPAFLAEVEKRSVGVNYPAINTTDLADIPISVHPLSRQRAIADYLDRETARLDALLAAKERLLALLAEKRRALVTRAVTRGLDPRVPTRDSGVPWLGEIPAHWEIKRLKHVGQTIIGLTYDPKNVVNDDNGVLVLRASNVQDQKVVISDDSMSVVMDIPEHLRTRAGDILICSRSGSRNLIGKSALIGESFAGCTFGVFMTVFRSVHACERYMFCVLNSPMFDFQAGSFSTSTINQLTVETLENMKVPLPPRSEQTEISRYLGGETKRIGLLIDKTRETIHLLSERRAALITAAVTGQTGHLAKDIG